MRATTPALFPATRTRRVCWSFLLVGFFALYPVQSRIDGELGAFAGVADVLCVSSGETLRYLSVGCEGLLADVYWTRVVQYFGRKRLAHAMRYELLGPLLRITTELDPHLLIAYRYGSIFLAEKPPGGAGQPEEAIQLISRGIVANPDYWRLWQDLGFVYYWDLKDYATAARVFRVGGERPGAMVWMKVMAAAVSGEGGESGTSRLLWSEIYRQADNDQVRQSALEHLAALETEERIKQLNDMLEKYQSGKGEAAHSFSELVAARYLPAAPKDPSGAPYVVGPDGRAGLSPESKIDMRLVQ